jgi:hypothetical protein
MWNTLNKSLLSGLALSGLIVLGTAGTARADDSTDRCGERINHEQHELRRAIVRHGYDCRQADHERRELNRLGYECRYR